MYRIQIGIALFAAMSLNAASPTYLDSVHAWQKDRDHRLRETDSWLTLAGLFWLEPDKAQTIGTAERNDFVLPKGSAPDIIGRLRLSGSKVLFTNLGGSRVTVDGKPVRRDTELRYSEDRDPDIVKAGRISFFVIQRGDRFAVRAKDSGSAVLKNFTGLTYFPIRPEFHFNAKFVPEIKKVPILNVLGETDMEESPGIVEFTFQGKEYRLRPIFEGDTLFFLFKDPTNRTETYQAGRMLNTPKPKDGRVDLDFNKSYNPPCIFTPYATCPLPPKENTLTFPVEAGELRYGKGHI